MSAQTEAVGVEVAGVRPWPENCCATPESGRERMVHPHRWEGWLCYVNGHVMVGIPDDGREVAGEPLGGTDVYHQLTGPLAGEVVEVPLPAFRAWCGPFAETCPTCQGKTKETECPNCWGTGEIDCECDCGHVHEAVCEDCSGTGKGGCRKCEGKGFVGMEADPRRGTLRGKHFNRRIMAGAIAGAPGATLRLACGAKEEAPFMLEGDGWRALVMPMRGECIGEGTDISALEDMPGFPTPVAP